MWKVVPTDEEEALALEVPGLLPSGAADKREYQIQRKFDELTKGFGATYLRWFAGEALYTLLENDMEGALEYCEIIQGMFLEGARLGQLVPRTNAIRAGLSIKVFADGYSSVPSLRPFNDESFDCFKRVFITRRDLEQSCFKTLANGARKNKSFEELFKEVSQKSSYEIENCQEIEDFIARVQQPDPKDDLSDLPARMPFYKGAIRNKTYAFFANKYVELIGERAARLLHPSDMTELDEKYSSLKHYAENLKTLSDHRLTDANRTSLSQLKTRLEDSNDELVSELAIKRLEKMDSEVDEAFVSSTDFLALITKLKAGKIPNATLTNVGDAILDCIKDMWPVFGAMHDSTIQKEERKMLIL